VNSCDSDAYPVCGIAISSLIPPNSQTRHLFLARLLDALLPGVHGALAAGLLGHLLASLLVCVNVSMASLQRIVVIRLEAECRMRNGRKRRGGVGRGWGKRTSHLLLLEGHILVVHLAGGLLLGLLVVDGVGTRCITDLSARRKTRSRWRWWGKLRTSLS
jgi:hypothetical protein